MAPCLLYIMCLVSFVLSCSWYNYWIHVYPQRPHVCFHWWVKSFINERADIWGTFRWWWWQSYVTEVISRGLLGTIATQQLWSGTTEDPNCLWTLRAVWLICTTRGYAQYGSARSLISCTMFAMYDALDTWAGYGSVFASSLTAMWCTSYLHSYG